MTTTWHAEDDLLATYAAGGADDVLASSVEAHLVACDPCRSRLAQHVPQDRLASNWEAVVVTLDAPRAGLVERLLVRVGLSPRTARLLVATPALRWSWAASVSMALTFSLIAATRPGTEGLLLLLAAPLVPLAGVALAFNRSLDPSADIVDATPLGGLPLLFLRTASTVAPSICIAGVAGLAVAPIDETWWLWLLPALALSALSLLLSSLAPIGKVAAALGALWAAGVVVTEAAARGSLHALRAGGPPESLLFRTPAQVLAAAAAGLAAAAVVALTRRNAEPWRRS